MDIVYIVQRKQAIRSVVQGKRPGQPVDPLPLPTYRYVSVDTRTGDYVGSWDTEKEAQDHCNDMNARLPQNRRP